MTKLAVVLVSGGMDSCVTAALAAEGREVAFLHVMYGQRTAARELKAFHEIADFYDVETRLVTDVSIFSQIGGSALTDEQVPVPPAPASMRVVASSTPPRHEMAANIPVTYVPFRNTHLLAIGVSWAEVIGASQIFIGAVSEDSSGYPDCRPEYYRAFNRLIDLGTKPETHIEVITPLIHMRKSAIVRQGLALGAPLHLSWTCYQAEDRACGRCESCALRIRAFRQAGVIDPIPYALSIDWDGGTPPFTEPAVRAKV